MIAEIDIADKHCVPIPGPQHHRKVAIEVLREELGAWVGPKRVDGFGTIGVLLRARGPTYSLRSAMMGSTPAALLAGTQLATTAASPSATAAPPNATMSVGGTP